MRAAWFASSVKADRRARNAEEFEGAQARSTPVTEKALGVADMEREWLPN